MWQDIAYDADKNITSLTVATPDKILPQNTYRYDGNGQRIEKNKLTGKTLYTYDSLNRLQQAEYPTHTERFTYDQAGNDNFNRNGFGYIFPFHKVLISVNKIAVFI